MFDSFRFSIVSLVDKCLCYAIEQNVIFGCSLFSKWRFTSVNCFGLGFFYVNLVTFM